MGSLSIWHWVIVLLVIVLVFGTSKLRNIGKDLGEGVKGFKEGVRDATSDNATAKKEALDGKTIDAEIKEKEKSSA